MYILLSSDSNFMIQVPLECIVVRDHKQLLEVFDLADLLG